LIIGPVYRTQNARPIQIFNIQLIALKLFW
jgi:hypothetical protein